MSRWLNSVTSGLASKPEWRCGKCEGLHVPEHHRTCPLRTSPAPATAPIRVDASTPEKQERLIELMRVTEARAAAEAQAKRELDVAVRDRGLVFYVADLLQEIAELRSMARTGIGLDFKRRAEQAESAIREAAPQLRAAGFVRLVRLVDQ